MTIDGVPIAATCTIGGTGIAIAGGVSVAATCTTGGTGTMVQRVAGVAIDMLCTIGGYPLQGPTYLPYPITYTVDDLDVSALVVEGTTWSRGINGTSSATLVLDDLDGLISWPLPPGDDPEADPVTLAQVTIAGRRLWFSGVVVTPRREWHGPSGDGNPACWRYTFTCEGDERILQIDPQDTYAASDYLTVTAPNGTLYMRAVDTSDMVPAGIGYPWVGKRNNPLGSAFRRPLTESTWVWPPGATEPEIIGSYWGGVDPADLRVPSRMIAPFRLSDSFVDGGVVPERVTETASGQNLREGVWVETRRPDVHAYVAGGPIGAGHDVIQVETSFFEMAQLAGLSHMSTRRTWEKRYQAIIPPKLLQVEPEPGRLVLAKYDPYITSPRYYLITTVSGQVVARGEGVDGVEWTVDFGNGTRPSFVVREGDAAADEVPPAPQASGCQVSPISWVGYEARQYAAAYPLDDDGKRMRVTGGTVEWTLHKLVGGSWLDIGAGSAVAGWWITEGRHTDVVFNDEEPLGYAYCEVNTGAEGTGPLPVDRLLLDARYIP